MNDTPDLSETHMDVTCTGGMDGSIDLTISRSALGHPLVKRGYDGRSSWTFRLATIRSV